MSGSRRRICFAKPNLRMIVLRWTLPPKLLVEFLEAAKVRRTVMQRRHGAIGAIGVGLSICRLIVAASPCRRRALSPVPRGREKSVAASPSVFVNERSVAGEVDLRELQWHPNRESWRHKKR